MLNTSLIEEAVFVKAAKPSSTVLSKASRSCCLFLGVFSVVLAPFAFSVSPVWLFLFLVDGVAYFLAAMYFQTQINREKFKIML
jgi:hypothetical protein